MIHAVYAALLLGLRRYALLLVLIVSGSAFAQCVEPPSGLISWWAGENNAADSFGQNAGVLENGVQFGPGRVGEGFICDGTSHYVRVPNSASLTPSESFSIELWIYPVRSGINQSLIAKWDETLGRSYNLAMTVANALVFGISDWAHQSDGAFHSFLTPDNVVPLNTWSHIVAAYEKNTGTRRIYINGTKIAERTDAPISIYATSSDLAVGARLATSLAPVSFFAGAIDELSIYGHALSEVQIATLYAAGASGKCPVSPFINTQPGSQTVNAGASVRFEVRVFGTGPFQYEWWFNGNILQGANSARLDLSDVQTVNAGSYHLVATSASGTVTSSDAILTVNPADHCVTAGDVIAWWPGDGNAFDFAGQGQNNGVPQNGVGFVSGRVGNAFAFNGTDQHVRIASKPSLAPSGSFTIDAWIFPVRSADQQIVSKWSDQVGRSYTFAVTSANALLFAIANTALQDDVGFHYFVTGDGLIPLNAWSHVAAVYDQSTGTRRLFFNGTKVAERTDTPITLFNSPGDVAIGARIDSDTTATGFFSGNIDEVSLSGRALSEAEIASIYGAWAGGKCKPYDKVFLQNATATFSQTAGGDYSAASMIDGVTSDNRGWRISPEIREQTAVFDTRENVGFAGGTVLSFSLAFKAGGTDGLTLGRFRLSVTTDPRNSFADGLQTGGDVSANWSVPDIMSATSQSGAVLTPLSDQSILVSGTLRSDDVYTVVTSTHLIGITGIRLEALTDPSLPHNGPGREPLTGNFNVSELNVSARQGEIPTISEQPASTTVGVGASATFHVTGSSSLPLSYQWYRNGMPVTSANGSVSGETSSLLTINPVSASDAGTYTVILNNGEGIMTSAGAVLNVRPVNTSSTARLFVSNHQPIDAPIFDPVGNRLNGPRYLAQLYSADASEIFRAVGPAFPLLTGADAGYFSEIELFLPDVAPGATARVILRVWDSVAGTTYEGAASNRGIRASTGVLETPTGDGTGPTPHLSGLSSFSLLVPPGITSDPVAKRIFVGQSASFSVEATGSTLSYQWKFNGNDISGANTALLALNNVQLDQAGEYRVVVGNALGTVTSAPVTLTVDLPDVTPPVIQITSPVAGDTYETNVTLGGTITDNIAVAAANWSPNNQAPTALVLQNGNFALANVPLNRGTNIFTISATDTSGNSSSASVTVVQQASRTLSVGLVAPVQEGAQITVPITLASRGDVSGLSFVLTYDVTYLADPVFVWDSSFQNAFTQVNTGTPGTIRVSFAFSGLVLPAGTQPVANLMLRTRSVPQVVTRPLALSQLSFFSATGDPLPPNDDARSGSVQINVRKYTGDNNANDRLDVSDASIIMRLVNRIELPRIWDTSANDLNKNFSLDVGDVIRVLRAVVDLDPQPGNVVSTAIEKNEIEFLSPSLVSGPVVTLQADKLQAAPGDTVTVTVNLNQMQDPLSGASFRLNYPAAALRLENFSAHRTGSLVPANPVTLWNVSPSQTDYVNQDGTVSLAVSTDVNWPTNNGALAVFTFTVQNGGNNQFFWPIQISKVELSSGFRLLAVPGSQILISGFATDSDGDGLPDSFESASGLDPGDPSDAARDWDGDGFTNLKEFFAGTDPSNSRSALRITGTEFDNAGCRLQYNPISGRSSALELNGELSPQGWGSLISAWSANGSPLQQLDSTAVSQPKGFYRVTVSTTGGTIASESAGFYKLTLAGNSDTLVSMPFFRPAADLGAVVAVSGKTVQIRGTPAWNPGQWVYAAGVQPNTYFLLIRSGTEEGEYYTIVGNDANSVTLDMEDGSLSAVNAGDSVAIVPYWTLGTIFPAGQSIHASASPGSRITEVLMPDLERAGINLATARTYYFWNGAWRQVGQGNADKSDDVLLPDMFVWVRHNIGTSTELVSRGAVLSSKVRSHLRRNATMKQDNFLALPRPVAVPLNQSGLVESGAFRTSPSPASRLDELFIFDNSIATKNKSAIAAYYFWNDAWRRVGSGLSDVQADLVFKPGTGIILRAGAGPASAVLTNSATY